MIGRLRYIAEFRLIGSFALKVQRWRDARKLTSTKWNTAVLAPPLRVSSWTKELVSRHYLEGRYAEGVKPVAWVTSGAPVEHLKALGFYIHYPENHGALCGTRRAVVELSEAAEAAGYSRDICSYARADIGSLLSGKTPVGKLPRPDLLVTCTNICQTVLYWYQVLADYLKVPLVVIDAPFAYGEITKHAVEYVKKQIEKSIEEAERIARKDLAESKLRRVIELSKEAAHLWNQVLRKCRNKPAPISVFDQFIHMAPVVEMRGEEETIRFYRAMLRELDERIAAGTSAVKNEKKRIIWDNLPIWYRLRALAEHLGKRGVAVVASTYTNAWAELGEMMNPEKPVESMARVYLSPILNRGTGHKLKVMRDMIREFDADGVILHSDRSCKPYSIGQMDQRNELIGNLRVPALLLESDHADPRAFSDEQVFSRLDSFIEMMGV